MHNPYAAVTGSPLVDHEEGADVRLGSAPTRTGRSTTRSRAQCIAAALATSLLTLNACSSTTTANVETPTETPPGTPSPSSPSTALSEGSENATAIALADLTDGKTAQLTTDTLPAPPAGFTVADLAAFGDRAVDLINRGIAPEVSALDEDQALDYVFANQYESTTDELRAAFESISTEYSYAWVVASRFERPPTTPAEVLAARWQVTTTRGQSVDGPAPVLQVALSAAVEHRVPATGTNTAAGSMVPIVVQRTVIIRGFRPLGGPEWAPSIGYQANVFFGGKCALVNGGILTPATRPDTLDEDLRDLRKYLTKPKTITPATSAGSDLSKYVAKYCEDLPD